MRILYGVQGTGNGHITRARAMSQAFSQRNIPVDFLFSGREKTDYFSMECFGDFHVRRGLSFVTERGEVHYLKTVMQTNLWAFFQEVRGLDLTGYDLVINDFEPVSAWAARHQGVPCISLSHQNAFRYSVPLKGATWLDKTILQYFAPADYHLALHWYHFNQSILPPIVQTQSSSVGNERFILVYLPFEEIRQVCDLLTRFSHHQFVFYHPQVAKEQMVENIELKPLCHRSFQHHLHRCSGVIANGGFELPSEALSLGKKLLLKPLFGQFEQQSNVATLELLGLASSMDFLDASAISRWLNEYYAERVNYPDVASAVADWVIKGEWNDHSELCNLLWQQVDFPSYAVIN
ncbi:glycosyltransferase [Vibrio cincinnatiensis]|uniref:MJ1255/VC2487 family glycosyltransferase n=1 Tax=Vibrio cincinnatiensis TaxID=675 RepID=UPI001EDF6C70|nr:MJ1255/VC2487 family glycosyltransferase [Vibrio cincinnatiensis]MCG3758493.1 glycosyltransferase [Vibrio cincinnatiensis]MCG3761729.1 glycosyltransferase [Vibrio cincinnatiensis]